MAKTIAWTGIDPATLRAGQPATIADPKFIAEGANYVFAKLRTTVAVEDFQSYQNRSTAVGIHQGVGSAISTTNDGATYVDRLAGYYYGGSIDANNDQLTASIDCEAVTTDGAIRVQFKTLAGAVVDTLTITVTAAGGRAVREADAAGTTLDGGVEYHVVVGVRAGIGGQVKIYGLEISEFEIAVGDLP